MLILKYLMVITFLISVILYLKVNVYNSELDSIGDSNRLASLRLQGLRVKHHAVISTFCFISLVFHYRSNYVTISLFFLTTTLVYLYLVLDNLDLIYSIEREDDQEILTMKIKNCKLHRTHEIFSYKLSGKSINYSDEAIYIYGQKTVEYIKKLKSLDTGNHGYLIIKYYSESKRIVSINSSLELN